MPLRRLKPELRCARHPAARRVVLCGTVDRLSSTRDTLTLRRRFTFACITISSRQAISRLFALLSANERELNWGARVRGVSGEGVRSIGGARGVRARRLSGLGVSGRLVGAVIFH